MHKVAGQQWISTKLATLQRLRGWQRRTNDGSCCDQLSKRTRGRERERQPSLACIHTASAYVSVCVRVLLLHFSPSLSLEPNSHSQMHLVIVVVVVAHFCTLRCCCNWFSLLFTLILSGFAPIIWLISTMNIYNISLRYAIFSHLFDARMHTLTYTHWHWRHWRRSERTKKKKRQQQNEHATVDRERF